MWMGAAVQARLVKRMCSMVVQHGSVAAGLRDRVAPDNLADGGNVARRTATVRVNQAIEVLLMPLDSLVQRASLPNPVVSIEQAQALLFEHYGLQGQLYSLGSQQDLNFRVENPQGRWVLKFCHDEGAHQALAAQHAAMLHLARHDLPVPHALLAANGRDTMAVTLGQQRLQMRLLSYLEGQPLTRLK
ncbi:MAG: hypothetical protein EOP02_16710, partial [Proteobacteria bacterium]